MKDLSYLLPVYIVLYICIEVSSFSAVVEREDVLEKRSGIRPSFTALDLLPHIEHTIKGKNDQDDKDLDPGMMRGGGPPEDTAYAKATCTSYPGKVVCQMGRYTFLINNGEHKMDPEVIERFAAMVYHRSQEGESSFDVSIDLPNNGNLEGQQKLLETTTLQDITRVLVECTPIPDERRMLNPRFPPSEVVYSCKRKEIGSRSKVKKMIISVGTSGIVSAGDLVLPYNALFDKRFKRQRGSDIDKAGLAGYDVFWTSSTANNKLYGHECTTRVNSQWCPTADHSPKYPVLYEGGINRGSVAEGTASPGVVQVQGAAPIFVSGPQNGGVANSAQAGGTQNGGAIGVGNNPNPGAEVVPGLNVAQRKGAIGAQDRAMEIKNTALGVQNRVIEIQKTAIGVQNDAVGGAPKATMGEAPNAVMGGVQNTAIGVPNAPMGGVPNVQMGGVPNAMMGGPQNSAMGGVPNAPMGVPNVQTGGVPNEAIGAPPNAGMGLPNAPIGGMQNTAMGGAISPGVEVQTAARAAAAQRQGGLQREAPALAVTPNAAAAMPATLEAAERGALDLNMFSPDDRTGEAAMYSRTVYPLPMVRMYSDVCPTESAFPWCPKSGVGYTDCPANSGCVTLPECPTNVNGGGGPTKNNGGGPRRYRRDPQPGKKPPCPVARYRINRMRTSRRLGQRRPFSRMRKRQIPRMSSTSSGQHNATNFKAISFNNLSANSPDMNCFSTFNSMRFNLNSTNSSSNSVDPNSQSNQSNGSNCPTSNGISMSCVISCKPDTTLANGSNQGMANGSTTTTECPPPPPIYMGKQEIRRKRKRMNHLKWPSAARERYILE